LHCNLGILVSGRGSNLKALLAAIKRGSIKNAHVSVVISNRPDVPALQIARSFGVETEVIDSSEFKGAREEYDSLLVNSLERHGVSQKNGLVILAGFMRVLSQKFVARYSQRLINIHPSLLPAFPGLNSQRQALQYGAKVTGCTVHFVIPEVDAGPIIIQRAVTVREDDDEESLSKRILTQEHRILPEAVRLVVGGKLKVSGRRVLVSK
jgi:phosphoribosylglycinamide formyltransferase-1